VIAAARHYVARFFTSLSRRPPDPADEAWVRATVTAAEWPLYARLDHPDRRHSVFSGRELVRILGADADPVLVRASILHDVGKVHAHLGTVGRSVSTVLAHTLGGDRVRGWADRSGWRGRCGRYETHSERGAEELRAVGSPDVVVAWAAEHHHPDRIAALGLGPDVIAALVRADR
jgi:putative nucleotidyltransferase with HDIG domain